MLRHEPSLPCAPLSTEFAGLRIRSPCSPFHGLGVSYSVSHIRLANQEARAVSAADCTTELRVEQLLPETRGGDILAFRKHEKPNLIELFDLFEQTFPDKN